jgi:N-methylhydantoinase B
VTVFIIIVGKRRQADGGGYGDPYLRDPSAVARDFKNGRVSRNAAREDYGVVLDEVTASVKSEAIQALRSKRPDSRTRPNSD